MRLAAPFYQLPLTFDGARLAHEIGQFTEAEWRPHPQGHAGNSALPYIARGGNPNDDGVAGPMLPTPYLARCPYVMQVMAALQVPLGRSRLMRLDARAEATPHVDANYYWQQRVRVHVPVVTFPDVEFLCGDASTRMAAGECWIFDTWRMHNVLNPGAHMRTHLVIDTVGTASFWDRVLGRAPQLHVAFQPGAEVRLRYESENAPLVMSPWEVDDLWSGWVQDARSAGRDAAVLAAMDDAFRRLWRNWRAIWACAGARPDGWLEYAAIRDQFAELGRSLIGRIELPNTVDLGFLLQNTLAPVMIGQEVVSAIAAHRPVPLAAGQAAPSLDAGPTRASPAPPAVGAAVVPGAPHAPAAHPSAPHRVQIERPLIIVAAPRSGSSLLFETLAQMLPMVTVGGESHGQFESIAALRPGPDGHDSNRLEARDASPAIAGAVVANFVAALRDRDGHAPAAPRVRLLEKTPKNALRVPFLLQLFPDAQFVYLYRTPADNVSSLIEGWQSGRFVTYPDLPGWRGLPWSYLLVPGWRDLVGAPLPAIAAAQWQRTQALLLDDLEALPAGRVHALDYASFVAEPDRHVDEISAFAGVRRDRALPSALPFSQHTVSAPHPDKWRRNEQAIAPYRDALASVAARAAQFVADRRAQSPHVRR